MPTESSVDIVYSVTAISVSGNFSSSLKLSNAKIRYLLILKRSGAAQGRFEFGTLTFVALVVELQR